MLVLVPGARSCLASRRTPTHMSVSATSCTSSDAGSWAGFSWNTYQPKATATSTSTTLSIGIVIDSGASWYARWLSANPADPAAGSGIRSVLEVRGTRPRDRADARFTPLRAELLERLGVPTHHELDYLGKAVRNQRARQAPPAS